MKNNILKVKEYNLHGDLLYKRNSNGFEAWLEYDAKGNLTHFKNSYGVEIWEKYDDNGNRIHYKDSHGFEYWYDSDGKEISKEEYKKLHGAHP